MKNFENILEESIANSDIVRKMQGRLTKSETALRMSRLAIGATMRMIDEFNKGKMDAESLAKIMSKQRQDLKDAAISIAKAEK